MRNLLLSTVCVLSLSGCLMPSGINPTLGCSPISGCTEKDYYLPGKGDRAPKQSAFTKARLGAIGGTVIGAAIGSGNSPLTTALYSVVGLVVGHEIGATFDKVDQIHATMLIKQSLNHNVNGQESSWSNPDNQVKVTSTPIVTNGDCREFVTKIEVGKSHRNMRGSACKQNGDWILKELY